MNTHPTIQIANLESLCAENAEESLILEFKSCNEIRVGTNFYDKKKKEMSIRTKDDIVDELSRDVAAFLNAAGGTIIYGVQEKDSRAKDVDRTKSFKPGENIIPETIVQWVRAYVQPSPTVDVYRVFEDSSNSSSPWYIVIDIPQGQQAYMARDHRFYKRVGNIVQPMEQYEIVDVMNRTRAAQLVLQIGARTSRNVLKEDRVNVGLDIAITSSNFISSEHGALKLTIAWPATFSDSTESIFGGNSQFERQTGLQLEGNTDIPHAESALIRWGANTGNIIFPGNWHNFYGNSIYFEVPNISIIPMPTYLILAELFTLNSQSKKALYAIRQKSDSDDFEVIEVAPETYSNIVEDYWKTFHLVREKFQP
jgi:hypothetical protein